jgi:hypothetical protein
MQDGNTVSEARYLKFAIIVLLALMPAGAIVWHNRYNISTHLKSVSGAYLPLNQNEVLGIDRGVNARGFASIIHDNSGFKMYFIERSRRDNEFTINLRQSDTLSGLSNAKSEMLFGSKQANVETQVWMPYVFKANKKYYMYFTARSGDRTTDNYIENIRMAISDDGLKWSILRKPVLEPKLKWEGNEVENWGIIKHNDTYYMSYESRGPSRLQDNRSIGIAYSKNLFEWKRFQDVPHVTESEYCSSFFRVGKYIYHIVPNNQRFRVYKFTDFEDFDSESFIGFWDPLGKENELSFDSPDVLTRDINKSLNDNEEVNIFYSVDSNGWRTLRSRYKNAYEFIESLSKF